MARSLRCLLVLVLAVSPAVAQIKVTVKTLNDVGFSLIKANQSRVTKNLPANKTFATFDSVYYAQGNPWSFMESKVTPPYVTSRVTWNRFGLSNSMRAAKGAGHLGWHTTGSIAGTAGAQKCRITITTLKPTRIILETTARATLYDNASASLKLSGAGLNKAWSWSKPGTYTDKGNLYIQVNGTVNLTAESVGSGKSGAGTGSYDGFQSSLYFYVIEDRTASFSLFGKGCGTAVMGGSGAPKLATVYKLNLDGAPAGAPCALMLGKSKDWFHFIKLPLDLTYMGATGCFVNVHFIYPIGRKADLKGHAECKIPLSKYNSGVWYLQWIVYDPKPNTAGFTTTQGAELKY